MRTHLLGIAALLVLVASWVLDLDAEDAAPGLDLAEPADQVAVASTAEPVLLGRPAPLPSERNEADEEVVEEEVDLDFVDDPPPDPIETGSSTLVLELRSDVSEEPFDTEVDLWRLDAPGNAHWRRGDQLQASVRAREGRVEIHDLPEGRYRIHAHAQRKASADPVGFEVRGRETRVIVRLPAPRMFPAYVVVLDENGNRLTNGTIRQAGSSSYSTLPGRPKWVKQRYLRDGFRGLVGIGGCGCGSGLRRGCRRPLSAGVHGFPLGHKREDQRYRSRARSCELEFEGRSAVSVYLGTGVRGALHYRSVSVPLEWVQERIELPDGSLAVRAGARIRVDGRAVLTSPEKPAADWQDLRVQVRVRLAGYEDLDFTFCLRDGHWTRTLRPKE